MRRIYADSSGLISFTKVLHTESELSISPLAGVAGIRSEVGSRALDWIVENLEQFDPFAPGHEPNEFHQTSLGELGLLCYLMRRGDAPTDNRVERCLEFLYSIYSSPAYHEMVFQLPQAFVGHLPIWLALRDRGIEKKVGRDVLVSLINQVSAFVLRYDPYRIIELSYLLQLAGFNHSLPADEEVFQKTVLGKATEGYLSEAQLYNVTHTVFYLTDFGLRSPGLFTERHYQFAQSRLDLGMNLSVATQNWDLVGEIILAFRCLGFENEPAVATGWRALRAAQEPSGMIGQSQSSGTPSVETPCLKDDEGFVTCYHRTLVAGLAGLIPCRQLEGGKDDQRQSST